MPRGKPKTHEQWVQEGRMRERWLSRQPPLKSPCLRGRRAHSFGRGFGKIKERCMWCDKTREQIKREQKGVKG